MANLIYAADKEDLARHVIRDSGVEAICHALDLCRDNFNFAWSAENSNLLASILCPICLDCRGRKEDV